MPTLQVRDLPEDIYIKLNLVANQENRSLAQQTIVLLRESLGLPNNNKLRREAVIEKLSEKGYPNETHVNPVDVIREDRDR
ncbi:hypothetical protein [Sediminispirochaeta smaragdinae]|uniref:Arc-like DNA binding domain-containing protein n=1 Tax=Sediminispirochaeta smaragdinae (strain DSM 11293 / JCM 15392 / SEBR 4228) TaxID=573413 RepID=E1R4K2_SEDSS|nr:hypothetical protein [Sediminispirochaeta smaragdinae]ADK79835.1 conserved hypothetical protein [Sediminispirochaeta smaragdinae DSM 11293]ADK81743.1 conserved hypothetical protein [Sediminispirochaeta smaragdinae DSM 11293]